MTSVFGKKIKIIFCLFCSLFLLIGQADAANVIKDIRTGQQPDGLRLVIDGTNKFDYDAFLLDNPNRLVIDVKDAKIDGKPKVLKNKLVSEIRYGDLNSIKGKRIVFVLNGNVDIKKKFILEPSNSQKNWRLVIDLSTGGENITSPKVAVSNNANRSIMRKKIVVLDPGV